MAGFGYTKQDNERDAAADKAYWDKVAAQRGGGIAAPPMSAEDQARNTSYLNARQQGGIASEAGLRSRNMVGDVTRAVGAAQDAVRGIGKAAVTPVAQFGKALVTGDTSPVFASTTQAATPSADLSNVPAQRPGDFPYLMGGQNPQSFLPPPAPAPISAMPQAPTYPASMAAVPEGTGFIRNSRTGKVTQVGGPQNTASIDAAPSTTGGRYLPPSYATAAQTAAEKAAADKIGMATSLMNREGGGIGEGIVARSALNQAGVLGGIAAQQSAAGTARKNADTAEQQQGIATETALMGIARHKQLQALYAKLKASTDKTERARLLQEIYALSGKSQQERYLAMQDPSTTDALGSKIGGAKYWMDPNTGQVMRGDGGAQPQARSVTKAEMKAAAAKWGMSEADATAYIRKNGGTVE